MTTLVTGGGGYIGSHVVRLLRDRGESVVVADDFVTGLRSRVTGIPQLDVDLHAHGAVDALADFIETHRVTEVMHFAARKQVGESMSDPVKYYRENLGALENVLSAMDRHGVAQLVFSSSAAVYGDTAAGHVGEDDRTSPSNPYGETKLAGEWLTTAWARARQARAINLRYFNVAGAGWDDLGDQHALNLIPMVFERLTAGHPPRIFGNDYDTPDGTCVRDFVHVLDLADAHLSAAVALRTLDDGTSDVLNVGTGCGSSVSEVIGMIRHVSGHDIAPSIEPRRAGDPAVVVASVDKISKVLSWHASRDLEQMIRSAWSAWSHRSVTKA